MQEDVSTITGRIRHARAIAQLRPEDMRRLLKERGIKLSTSGYRRIENEEPTNPKLEVMIAIADITGTTPQWLLFGGDAIEVNDSQRMLRRSLIETMERIGALLSMTKRQRTSFTKLIESLRLSK